MRGEYRYVGPALNVLSTMPELAKLVTEGYTKVPVRPLCVWAEVLHTWIQLDGERISGWDDNEYFAFRPNWLNRWKIRRAGRRWQRAALTPTNNEVSDEG